MWKYSGREKEDGNAEVDLSLTNLEVVPVSELKKLHQVTQLDLSCNLLVQITDAFCTLVHLVKIDLSRNKLTGLPPAFGQLKNLQHLDVLGNRIESLPSSFGQLCKLTWLDLKDNPLEPDLKRAAGDCLDERQCRTCAKTVLVFMRKVAGMDTAGIMLAGTKETQNEKERDCRGTESERTHLLERAGNGNVQILETVAQIRAEIGKMSQNVTEIRNVPVKSQSTRTDSTDAYTREEKITVQLPRSTGSGTNLMPQTLIQEQILISLSKLKDELHELKQAKSEMATTGTASVNSPIVSGDGTLVSMGNRKTQKQAVNAATPGAPALDEKSSTQKEQKSVTLTIDTPPHKLALLADFLGGYRNHGCQVIDNREKGEVKLCGTEEACQKARCELLTRIQNLNECHWTVPGPFVRILNSIRGQRFLYEVLQKYPSCTLSRQHFPSAIEVASCREHDAKAVVEHLKGQAQSKSCQVCTKTLHLCHQKYLTLKTRLEEVYCVCVSHSPTDHPTTTVTVFGFGEDVDHAVREIEKWIQIHLTVKETYILPDLVGKACLLWFSQELEKVKAEFVQNGGQYFQAIQSEFNVTMEGGQGALEAAKVRLNSISGRIHTTKVDINIALESYSERALVINGLHDGDVQFILSLEEDLLKQDGVQVVAELRLPPRCSIPQLRVKPARGMQHLGASVHHLDDSENIQIFTVHLGKTEVAVKCGDISSEEVDVLVSPITEKLNIGETAVGRAIVHKLSVSKKLQSSDKSKVPQALNQCQVFLTPVQDKGDAHAPKAVLFAVIHKWPSTSLLTNVKLLLQACLTVATQAGFKSIAIPPFGIGKLFQFPEETVISGMVSGLQEFLRDNPLSLQRVIIVANKSFLAKSFHKCLQKTASHTGEDSDGQDDGDDENHDDSNVAVSGTLEVSFCTQGTTYDSYLRDRLMTKIRKEFLFTTTLDDGQVLRKLHPNDISQITTDAVKKNVLLRMHEKGTKLTASGTKVAVTEVICLISQKFMEHRSHLDLAQSEWRVAACIPVITHRPPSYWEISQRLEPHDTCEKAVHLLAGQESKLKPVTPEESKAVALLMWTHWNPGIVGIGKDARNLKHKNIQVLEVARLENPVLWEQYSEAREKLLRRLANQTSLPPVETLTPSGPVKTTQSLPADSPLRRDIYPQVNEHYLFHGTKLDLRVPIMRDGLDARLAASRSMLGRGIYAAESPTKSDQYTDVKAVRTDGEKLMILVRMLLGDPLVTNQRVQFERPPCKKCSQVKCLCENSGQYNSILYDPTQGLFREFIVYERCLCYPEYFITYKRIG